MSLSAHADSARHCYVVCYDIAHNRRRARVAKCLAGFGGRVQESVFEAELDARLFDILLSKLCKLIDTAKDSVVIYPLPPSVSDRRMELGLAAAPRPKAVNCIVV